MGTDARLVTHLFNGVCPSCGTVGLEILRAGGSAGLSCPNCEWDSRTAPASETQREGRVKTTVSPGQPRTRTEL